MKLYKGKPEQALHEFRSTNGDVLLLRQQALSNPLEIKAVVRVGIYINDSGRDFTGLIFDGLKDIETRAKDTLSRFSGQWLGVIRSGCPGRNGLCGFIMIGKGMYWDWNEFWSPRNQGRHWVPLGSAYAPARGEGKFAYPIHAAVKIPLMRLPPTRAKGPKTWRLI